MGLTPLKVKGLDGEASAFFSFSVDVLAAFFVVVDACVSLCVAEAFGWSVSLGSALEAEGFSWDGALGLASSLCVSEALGSAFDSVAVDLI